MFEDSVGPNWTAKLSSGAPGNSRNLFPASSFTANPPSSTRKSAGTFPTSSFSKLFWYKTSAAERLAPQSSPVKINPTFRGPPGRRVVLIIFSRITHHELRTTHHLSFIPQRLQQIATDRIFGRQPGP